MESLISSGSPLNNLRTIKLGVLTDDDAQELINFGFLKVEDEKRKILLELTVKHPYLLRGVLEELWLTKLEWNQSIIKEAADRFLEQHGDFQHWIKTFGEVEKAIYYCLATSHEDKISFTNLKNKLEYSLQSKARHAIKVLNYHGVIDAPTLKELKIAGTMFKNWYLENTTLPQNKISRNILKENTKKLDSSLDLKKIAIIIPLKEEFKEFFKEIEGRFTTEQEAETYHTYYLFNYPFEREIKPFICAATFIGDMGLTKAALAAEKFISKWRPDLTIMLGIAAGIDGDIKVGDVVVATSVDCYSESAKAVDEDDPGHFTLKFAGESYPTTQKFINLIRHFEFVQQEIFQNWQMQCQTQLKSILSDELYHQLGESEVIRTSPIIQEAHLASGPFVTASEIFNKWIHSRDRKIKAVEMESGGMMIDIYSNLHPTETIVLRGISDYGDHRKKQLDMIKEGGLRRYAMGNVIKLLWSILDTLQ
jgi:nucleoside phosphorylase